MWYTFLGLGLFAEEGNIFTFYSEIIIMLAVTSSEKSKIMLAVNL
jgi:hypothetical protein